MVHTCSLYAHMLRSCGGAKGVNKRVHSSISRDRCGPARVSRVGRVHVPRPDTWGAHGKLPGKSYDLSGTKIGKRAQCAADPLRRRWRGGRARAAEKICCRSGQPLSRAARYACAQFWCISAGPKKLVIIVRAV